MTYTYKLARRLARLRKGAAFLLPILAACSAGEPTDISSDNPPIGADANGAVALSPRAVTLEADQRVLFRAFESLIPGHLNRMDGDRRHHRRGRELLAHCDRRVQSGRAPQGEPA